MVIPGEAPFLGTASIGPTETDAQCRILLVDDDAALRNTLPHVLAQPGRVFEQCGNVAQALARLERERYELILLDYRLPDGTGLDVLDWLANARRDEAVVMISGEDAIDAAIGALRRGADDFVRKPYHVAQLQRAVQNALHKALLERANLAMSQRLKGSERLHRYLVESSPDFIFTLNPAGVFTYVNPRVESMLGYPRQHLIGKPFTLLPVEEDGARVDKMMSDANSGRRAHQSLELRLRRHDPTLGRPGEAVVSVALNVVPIQGRNADDMSDVPVGVYGVARDISDRKRAEEIITFQAYHDQLTHLPNRILFKDRLELAIAQAQRRGGLLAVMFIDVDRFKLVNDTYGHSEGDRLLLGIAQRVKDTLRRGDTLARLGGDEFTVLLPDISHPEDAEIIAMKIQDALAAPFQLKNGSFHATVSMGIAVFPRDGEVAEMLTQHADIAMYQIKRGGKNGFRFFDPDLNLHYRERIKLENDLRGALDRGEFILHYQPQVSVSEQRVVGLEALLRWRHPSLGLITPPAFIQVAEEVGLIGDISRWVVDTATAQLAQWQRDGFRDLRLSINLSSHDFDRDETIDRVAERVAHHGLLPDRFDVEITESVMMRDTSEVVARVQRLRECGVGISIDDFGTGYSALAYLQKFPVSSLKIDRSFVSELDGPAAMPIIAAITGIARGFDLHLVVEGVEQAEQAERLRHLGCDIMQGYFFSAAVTAAEAEAWLRQPRALLC
ncbi:EAL domain-containing protein [Nitrogeniibacter mangrovi]|uniref:EAL domain-containing protein n=1 Tax=Nitrogeniibacter mangrovi TaxID=2016596 RepID=A0A6C1B223_9RHOO|nr:EAL domain-containing protein [Nitrogeniibacter mangrovi]QID16878.1 EAL domain-containing protein [Nitrogeniibacter mangrovi]